MLEINFTVECSDINLMVLEIMEDLRIRSI